ncbi:MULTISPECIES: hypothetical protein [Rhizobium]|uniref:hypothetical protein n=1 Tax=Rhizobium TaxID=379 RepID=UPI001013D764|nr:MULTISPECIES: hypothetical protein [Rhizobium]MBY3249876.1 hypothetical protein [Rhizobium laguerreae]NEI94586.1 hypothetical protein [Rhizobium leguminosarum]NEJ78799.1 hypothetical protein [Rhizobium leguminosarum]
MQTKLILIIASVGMAIIGIISISIVGAVIYSSITYGKPPEILSNWGGLIIGFFIGSFFNFVRVALGVGDPKG